MSNTSTEMMSWLDANNTCSSPLDAVPWDDAGLFVSLFILLAINVVVIGGNCLVILAVFLSHKLRTVTNLFIVSLAMADLMVGIAVLPFSATAEVFKVWFFGDIWCSIWLAVDVWMCTASILNLCAISLDRYVAVTRPVSYPSIMSSKRAKMLIAGVWVLSFLICFPPLVGWNDDSHIILLFSGGLNRPATPSSSSSSSSSTSSSSLTPRQLIQQPLVVNASFNGSFLQPMDAEPTCQWKCELTNERGYVVYSACGSFFLPMFVMLFFYWRIYRAAVETTRAINRGFRTTKGSRIMGSRFEEQRLTLRIHRGRSVMHHANGGSNNSESSMKGSSRRLPRAKSSDRITISVSEATPLTTSPCSPCGGPPTSPPLSGSNTHTFNPHHRRASSLRPSMYSVRYQGGVLRHEKVCDPTRLHLGILSPSSTPSLTPTGTTMANNHSDSDPSTPTPSPSPTAPYRTIGCEESISSSSEDANRPRLISKMGKRNIKAQVKRFKTETKAAKTLGIIVGGFILCWLPFFTMYVIRAFCEECIPSLLFSVFFWLGYCNSALNPCIYALFSKDFRFAFKKLLCRCSCKRERRPSPSTAALTAAVIHKGHRGSGCSQNPPICLSSLGDDSEGNNEPTSDSR